MNTSYTYDSLSRLLSVLHQAGTVTLDGASYTYDNAGNRVSKTNSLNNTTENYTYDPLYQLTQVAQGLTTTESYTYDAVGNRLSSLEMTPYAYNSSNELTSTPSATFTYDANGNTLTKVDSNGTTTYGWDFENRLTSVALPGGAGTVTFKYDPLGRRIQKSSASGTTNYLYDGSNSVEEVDQTGAELAHYSQGAEIDEPLAAARGGAIGFYEQDGIGSVTSLTGSTGTVLNSYTYDAFGNVANSTGSFINPYQFTGRDDDPETGLRYYRARYYDPRVGRFISEDPLRFKGSGPNFYGYVRNSATNFIDPFGLTFIAYIVSTGQLVVDPEQPGRPPYIIPATSGRGACMNQPRCSSKKDTGPIPPGIYNIKASEISQPGWFGDIARLLRSREDWGSFRVPLTPAPLTDSLGRSGFFLHGGIWPGSAGCIDVGGRLFGDDTTNRLVQDLRADPDGIIPLVVFPTTPNIRIPIFPLP